MKDFYRTLYEGHKNKEKYPECLVIEKSMEKLFDFLFPQRTLSRCKNLEECERTFQSIQESWYNLVFLKMGFKTKKILNETFEKFISKIPVIFEKTEKDLQAIEKGDPAAKNQDEIIRSYPGFYAIFFYRVAHELYNLELYILARDISEIAHRKTGIDIHPGSIIGSYFCIDHGTGIVIGESCKIGDWVKLYQGVTLGALSVDKKLKNKKRHPNIQDNVVIYSGATILGGNTIIGENSVIGGNVWLTESVEPNLTVSQKTVNYFRGRK